MSSPAGTLWSVVTLEFFQQHGFPSAADARDFCRVRPIDAHEGLLCGRTVGPVGIDHVAIGINRPVRLQPSCDADLEGWTPGLCRFWASPLWSGFWRQFRRNCSIRRVRLWPLVTALSRQRNIHRSGGPLPRLCPRMVMRDLSIAPRAISRAVGPRRHISMSQV
jgi:hypothetical protein